MSDAVVLVVDDAAADCRLPNGATIERRIPKNEFRKRVLVFAQDYRDGKFKLPIVRRYALHEAVEAQTFAEKGGTGGKVLLLAL